MAVPAAIVAIVFIDLGGLAFALFLIAIGCICLHELYRLLARWRPVSVVGFAALAGMVLAARYGSQRVVMEVAVGALPVLFLGVGLPGDRIHAPNERMVMDQFWKGLLAAAELWRELGDLGRAGVRGG